MRLRANNADAKFVMAIKAIQASTRNPNNKVGLQILHIHTTQVAPKQCRWFSVLIVVTEATTMTKEN